MTDLDQLLADVVRLPESRQRDAADCIDRTLAMDDEAIARWNLQNEQPVEPIDFPDGFFDDMPAHLTAQVVPRNPFINAPRLTDELSVALQRIRSASASRQRAGAYILAQLVENDRWDVLLTPEQRASLL